MDIRPTRVTDESFDHGDAWAALTSRLTRTCCSYLASIRTVSVSWCFDSTDNRLLLNSCSTSSSVSATTRGRSISTICPSCFDGR